MPQSFGSLHCHFVFSTKQRRPTLGDEWRPRLYEYIGGILRSQSNCLVAAGGTPDHIHLLVSLCRTLAIADVVRLIKANSSAWIHDTLELSEFQWQNGYGAFAVSYSNLETVKRYLANQRRHHSRMSFQEEFLELLKRHDIESDERYIWD